MANSILNSQKIDSGVAVVVTTDVVDSIVEYQNNIESLLNRNCKWVEIIKLEEFPQKNKYNYYPIRVIQDLINYRKSIENRVHFYYEIIQKYEIDEVLLVSLNDKINEASLAYVASKFNIRTSIYDETVYSGYVKGIFSKYKVTPKSNINKFKSVFKPVIFQVIFGKYLRILKKFSKIDKIKLENYYSLFPHLYPYQNVNSLVKVIPKFERVEINIGSLLLTSCLSEDGIITLDEELELIQYIASYLPVDTVVRFHPRDSKEKKIRILHLTEFRELDVQVEAAEMLLFSPKLKTVSGYMTSTLFVATTLRPELEVNSFVGCLGIERISKTAIRRISKDFPTINFHDVL